jgi:hypothetical protein
MDFEAAQMAADESFSNAPFARAAIVKIDSILHEVETALLTGSKLSVSSEFEDLNRQPALNDASVWREHDEMINSLETLCGYLKTWLAMRNDESKLRSFS